MNKIMIKFFVSMFFYVLIALFIFNVTSTERMSLLRDYYIGGGSDPISFIWFINWLPYAIKNNLNVFYTHMIWAPIGVNLSWTTSIPSLAFLAWPITKVYGAIASYNFLMIISPILAAQAAFLMINEVCQKWWPSFIGGYLFGFSSYEFGQLLGHTNLTFTAFIPIIILAFILSYKNHWKKLKTGLIAGIFLAFQFYTSSEIFTTFFIFGVMFISITFIFVPEKTKSIINFLPNIIYSYIVALILMIPVLIEMFFDKNPFSGGDSPNPEGFSTDLSNLFIPTPITMLGGHYFYFISKLFHGNFSEDGSYIGIFFILIVAFIAITNKKNKFLKSLLLFFTMVIVASFGPILHIAGVPVSTAPWVLMYHLPLIRFALPVRFMVYAWLTLGLIISLWLSIKSTKSVLFIKNIVIFCGLISIFPNIHIYQNWSELHIPLIYSTGKICKINRNYGGNLLIFPYGLSGNSMAFQIKSKMCFHMAEGYSGSTPYPFRMWQIVKLMTMGEYSSISPTELSDYIATYNVRNILVPENLPNKKILQEKLNEAHMVQLYHIQSNLIYRRSSNFNGKILTANKIKEYKSIYQKKWERKNIKNNRFVIRKISENIFIPARYSEELYSWLIKNGLAY